MIRSHGPLVIYGEVMDLPPELAVKFESFSQWLTSELAVLEARWTPHAAPLARTALQQK